MKRFLKLLPLLLTLSSARADLVVEQSIDSAFIKGSITMKIKGDKARMEMPSPAGAMSAIIDGATGDITSIMHAQKMVMKMNGADLKKQADASKGADTKLEKPKATGKKEKVGEYDTEVYELTVKDSGPVKIWVAPTFPNAEAIKAQMNKVSKNMPQGKGAFNPADIDVPGMPVKTEMDTPQGKLIVTLVKVKEEPVSDDEFKVPAGYQEMPMPTPGK